MAEKNVKILKGFKIPQKEGDFYRLLCMTGKNKGLAYFLNGSRIIMGRSEKVDIQVLDTKTSREHAELTLVNGEYVISDLGSQNGVVVNDLKISQVTLVKGDKVIIGQTIYKYDRIINSKTMVEVFEKDTVKIKNSSNDDEDDDEEELTEEDKAKKEKATKRNLVLGLLVFVLYFMLESGPKTQKKRSSGGPRTQIKDSLAESLREKKVVETDEEKKKVQTIILRGQREFREGNYFRAIDEFKLAKNGVKNTLDHMIELIFFLVRQLIGLMRK